MQKSLDPLERVVADSDPCSVPIAPAKRANQELGRLHLAENAPQKTPQTNIVALQRGPSTPSSFDVLALPLPHFFLHDLAVLQRDHAIRLVSERSVMRRQQDREPLPRRQALPYTNALPGGDSPWAPPPERVSWVASIRGFATSRSMWIASGRPSIQWGMSGTSASCALYDQVSGKNHHIRDEMTTLPRTPFLNSYRCGSG